MNCKDYQCLETRLYYNAQNMMATRYVKAKIIEEDMNKAIKEANNNKVPCPENMKMDLWNYGR